MNTQFGGLALSQPSAALPLPLAAKTLAMGLATQAFKLLGCDDFRVTADLDIRRPWTLEAFEGFQRVLLMAYNRGAQDMATSSRRGAVEGAKAPDLAVAAHERSAPVVSTAFDVLAWGSACDGFARSARRHAGDLDTQANGVYYSMAVDAALASIPAEHHRLAVSMAMERGAYVTLRLPRS